MKAKLEVSMNVHKTRIGVAQALANAGLEPDDYESLLDSIVPACCIEGCEVEPDGTCSHGNPSVLLEMGVI
jgi:hypothetical protein